MTTTSPPVSSVVDNLMTDEVMKRRLLIDGDGSGDDRRILNLTKSFLSFCSEDSAEDLALTRKKLLHQLAVVEHANLKTRFNVRANEEAKEMYIDLDAQVKEEIAKSREEIENSKKLLELAKEQRKHRTEYNALARLIRSQPDRKETEQKRQILEKQLADLKAKQNALDSRLDQRKRSMHVLVAAIGRLNDMIDEEALEEQHALEEAEKAAREIIKSPSKTLVGSIPGGDIPMEVDEPAAAAASSTPSAVQGSNPGSPLEQSIPEAPSTLAETRPVLGTVSSAPMSPIDPVKEKYDDLSESD